MLRRPGQGPPADPSALTGTVVYRPTFVRGLAVVVWALLGLFAVLAVRDDGASGLLAVPALLLVALVVHALFWRPSVEVDDESVLLRNVVRDVEVPFGALDAVDTRFALALLTGERKYTAWAAPAPGRRTSAGLGRRDVAGTDVLGETEMLTSSTAPNSDSGGAALLVRHRWERWQDAHRADADQPPAAVAVRWDRPLLLAVAVTAVAAALTLLV